MFMSFVFLEMGNLFFIIGICFKKFNSVIGKFYFYLNNFIFLKEMNSIINVVDVNIYFF